MNLFRSEEHVRRWSRFDPKAEEGIIALNDALRLMSGSYFRNRLETDWVSHREAYLLEMFAAVRKMGRTSPFWVRSES
jgi:hypothetical protein